MKGLRISYFVVKTTQKVDISGTVYSLKDKRIKFKHSFLV